jgi:hypothetical protein
MPIPFRSLRTFGGTLGFAAILILAICSATPSKAQETAGYRIRHYDLRIAPDFSTREIHIDATVWIDNPGLSDTFSFQLGDPYQCEAVTSSGKPARFKRDPGMITVTTARRKTVKLHFRLRATDPRSNDENRKVMDDSSLFLLWSDQFYPVRFEDWATVRTTVILPPRFQSIAPGKLVRTTREPTKVSYVFNSSLPAVQFSVFADANWIRTVRKVRGIRMQTLLYPESQKYSERIFSTSADVLHFYSDLYGPYPADQFSFVTLRGIHARRACAGFVVYEPKYLEKEMRTTGFDAHETALLWWDYTIRGRGPGSWQWTEGLGDYAEILYDEARNKPLDPVFATFRRRYLNLPADQDVPYDQLRGNTPQAIVHGKYPWLMQVLRYMVGDEAFRKAMRHLFAQYRFHTFTMDEMVASFEQATGKSLALWRTQWIDRKGVPTLAYGYSIEKGKPYRIRCTIEQMGQLYDLPLEVGIETDSGLQVKKLRLVERKQTFELESIEKPIQVTLDPHAWLLIKKRPLN